MIGFGRITGTIRLALLFIGLGAPAFSGCLSESELAQWSKRDTVPGIYDMVSNQLINLSVLIVRSGDRRSRHVSRFDESRRPIRFWLDGDVLVATLEADIFDRHFVLERADFPAEDLLGFDFAGELEFTEDDRAAEAELLSGCPFERLPRLIGRAEYVVERGTREVRGLSRLWLAHLGEIGMVGVLESRVGIDESSGMRTMALRPMALVPTQP